jgi:hypothetical protein
MSDKVGMGVRKDTADFFDSDSGAAIGSSIPILGTIIGGAIGAGVGLLAADLMTEEPEEVERE